MKINLDMQTLRSFIRVSELLSFTSAAESLRLTQPAISQQIRRLEELLGAELFVRGTKTLQLTSNGDKLLRYANEMVKLNDRAAEELSRTERREIVNLGMPEHFSDIVLPHIIRDVHQAFPSTQLVIKVGRSSVISEFIDQGRVDLGIVIEEQRPKVPSPMNAQMIEVRWFSSLSSPTVGYNEVPLVLFRSPCGFRNLAIRKLEEKNILWRCVYEAEDLVSLRSAVVAGVGVTALPYLQEVQGLKDIADDQILPSLPKCDLYLKRRTGWNAYNHEKITNLILGIWNTFQSNAKPL